MTEHEPIDIYDVAEEFLKRSAAARAKGNVIEARRLEAAHHACIPSQIVADQQIFDD